MTENDFVCTSNVLILSLRIASRYSNTLKGMIFTCKMNDEMFNERPVRLLEYLNEIETKIKKSNYL